VLSLVLLGAMTVCAQAEDIAKKDLSRLQGEWIAVSGRRDGKELDAKALSSTIKGDEVIIRRAGQIVEKVKIKLVPTSKRKAIDITIDEKTPLVQGIYELDGVTFRLCYARPGKARPTDFIAKEGSGHSLSVWKRDKE
jgi:uncharacterized protein (TIGR03067 family)